jgi:hypothetical protein
MSGEAENARRQAPLARYGRVLVAACLSVLLTLLTAACSGSDIGSSNKNRPASSASTSTSAGKHFLFYAVYRNSLGQHYFDLLEWRTDPNGVLSGTWTSVSFSSDSGRMLRDPDPFSGRQDGNNITIDTELGGTRGAHGSISGSTLTLDVDLAAQSNTYKATSREAFDKIVGKAEAAEASESP